MALQMFTKKIMNSCAKVYQKALASDLQAVGLRYEDLINENEKDVAEAMSLADPEIITGRTRRVKRAIDLDFKKKRLTDYAPDMDQQTFKEELYEDIVKIRARNQEFALLNSHKQ